MRYLFLFETTTKATAKSRKLKDIIMKTNNVILKEGGNDQMLFMGYLQKMNHAFVIVVAFSLINFF